MRWTNCKANHTYWASSPLPHVQKALLNSWQIALYQTNVSGEELHSILQQLTKELPAAATAAKVFMPRNMYLFPHWGASESETMCQLF